MYDGRKLSVSLFVEGDRVVGMTRVSGCCAATHAAAQRIITAKPGDEKRYLGDRMGAAIGKATGRKPCPGCKKVEAGLNGAHKFGQRIVRRLHR